jgi:hypothetical protein
MPVELITEDLLIEPNRVYIIPADRHLHVDGHMFHLARISKPRVWLDVITVVLRSLNQFWDGKLIAVIVSGPLRPAAQWARPSCGTASRRSARNDVVYRGFSGVSSLNTSAAVFCEGNRH